MQSIKETQTLYQASNAFEGIFMAALRLPPLQKIRLVEQLMSVLEKELVGSDKIVGNPLPRRSLFGILSHLGNAPSDKEIDEARSEAWANFLDEDL